jgi:hypothetical protein
LDLKHGCSRQDIFISDYASILFCSARDYDWLVSSHPINLLDGENRTWSHLVELIDHGDYSTMIDKINACGGAKWTCWLEHRVLLKKLLGEPLAERLAQWLPSGGRQKNWDRPVS